LASASGVFRIVSDTLIIFIHAGMRDVFSLSCSTSAFKLDNSVANSSRAASRLLCRPPVCSSVSYTTSKAVTTWFGFFHMNTKLVSNNFFILMFHINLLKCQIKVAIVNKNFTL